MHKEKNIEGKEKTREKIIRLLKKRPEITIKEMAVKIDITEKGIEWQLARLKEKKQIKRVGSRKNGLWKVIE